MSDSVEVGEQQKLVGKGGKAQVDEDNVLKIDIGDTDGTCSVRSRPLHPLWARMRPRQRPRMVEGELTGRARAALLPLLCGMRILRLHAGMPELQHGQHLFVLPVERHVRHRHINAVVDQGRE